MHAKNFIINQGSYRHTVEHILEFFPYANAIPSFALIIESIYAVYLAAFMVSTEEEKILFVLDFVSKK